MLENLKMCVAVCCLGLTPCAIGCGRGVGLTEINGTVLYKGKPVEKGTISFMPADGNGPTAAGIVADGKYVMKVSSGRKQVRIEAFHVKGQRRFLPNDPNSPMIDIQDQILPERYNAKSGLFRDVEAGGTFDFTLD